VFTSSYVLSTNLGLCKVWSSSLLALYSIFVNLYHCALDHTIIISTLLADKIKYIQIYFHSYVFISFFPSYFFCLSFSLTSHQCNRFLAPIVRTPISVVPCVLYAMNGFLVYYICIILFSYIPHILMLVKYIKLSKLFIIISTNYYYNL